MDDMINYDEVEGKVIVLGGRQILIDRDVAELYGVETKRINEAVRNNPDKFPEDYIFIVGKEDKSELVEKFDRFNSLKHTTVLPKAFTEKGLYMLATILKSPKATQTTIAIVETFAKIREMTKILSLLPDDKDDCQQKQLMQRCGEILGEILDDNVLEVSGDETTIEVNLAVMKLKHTVKREKRKNG